MFSRKNNNKILSKKLKGLLEILASHKELYFQEVSVISQKGLNMRKMYAISTLNRSIHAINAFIIILIAIIITFVFVILLPLLTNNNDEKMLTIKKFHQTK